MQHSMRANFEEKGLVGVTGFEPAASTSQTYKPPVNVDLEPFQRHSGKWRLLGCYAGNTGHKPTFEAILQGVPGCTSLYSVETKFGATLVKPGRGR